MTLDCVSRHTLTAWIAMTTMVGDYAQSGRAAISQAERTELYRHCEMNDTLSLHDWEISIGEYIGSELDNPYRRRYRYRIGASSTAQATTLRLGAAFLTAHSGLGALPGIIPILAAASFQPALIAVHPNAHETAWPPWLKVHDVLAERIVFRVREALQIGLSTNAPGFEQAGIEVRDRIDQQPDEWPPQQRRPPPLKP